MKYAFQIVGVFRSAPFGQFDPKAPLNSPLARGIGAGLFTRPWV